jgi:DMSO reductase family type II enzyme chaperone
MFVYSLAGLKVDGQELAEAVELPDNDITARTGVYQLLARLATSPDEDVWAGAVAGDWPKRLADAGRLLPFAFDFGVAPSLEGTSREDLEAEYLRLFEVGPGTGGPPAPIFGGVYGGGDRMRKLEEVVRFYEYFGLHASPEDPRPADHLSTELEFMKYLTYKEAVTTSPRLGGSYRRAQHDFIVRQLAPWLPEFVHRSEESRAAPFYSWAVATIGGFVAADAAYLSNLVA